MLCTYQEAGIPYVVVQFSLSRDLMGSLVNDFLPILLSMAIGHSTNYYNSFEIASVVNITLMLVLVTL